MHRLASLASLSRLCSLARHARPLTVLSWNIYGMEKRCRNARTVEACKTIVSAKPHAVYLQEVVPSAWSRITEHCDGRYHCYCSPGLLSARRDSPTCFQAILLRKPVSRCEEDGSPMPAGELVSVPLLRRDLLLLSTALPGPGPGPLRLLLATAHLKAGGGRAARAERMTELGVVAREMRERRKEKNEVCIFAGDLNVRWGEVQRAGPGLAAEAVDVWQHCGADSSTRLTWDPNINTNIPPQWRAKAFRFDRFYLSPLDGRVVPKGFSLVGRDGLPCCGRPVSDHWGVMATFKLGQHAHTVPITQPSCLHPFIGI